MDDLEIVGYCDWCGEPIYAECDYYELPDGEKLCGKDYDCIMSYVDKYYLKAGGIDA